MLEKDDNFLSYSQSVSCLQYMIHVCIVFQFKRGKKSTNEFHNCSDRSFSIALISPFPPLSEFVHICCKKPDI